MSDTVLKESVPMCRWQDDEDGVWQAGCGYEFVLNDGTPPENGMLYCPSCGGVISGLFRRADGRLVLSTDLNHIFAGKLFHATTEDKLDLMDKEEGDGDE